MCKGERCWKDRQTDRQIEKSKDQKERQKERMKERVKAKKRKEKKERQINRYSSIGGIWSDLETSLPSARFFYVFLTHMSHFV